MPSMGASWTVAVNKLGHSGYSNGSPWISENFNLCKLVWTKCTNCCTGTVGMKVGYRFSLLNEGFEFVLSLRFVMALLEWDVCFRNSNSSHFCRGWLADTSALKLRWQRLSMLRFLMRVCWKSLRHSTRPTFVFHFSTKKLRLQKSHHFVPTNIWYHCFCLHQVRETSCWDKLTEHEMTRQPLLFATKFRAAQAFFCFPFQQYQLPLLTLRISGPSSVVS